jgi:hypothetical protein
LDDWIYCTLYIHTIPDSRQYSAITIPHTLQFTVIHTLGFSVFTTRIMATDLSQPPSNFKSYTKSSFHSLIPILILFCNYEFRRINSIQFLCSRAHIPAGWRPETRLFALVSTTPLDSTPSRLLNVSICNPGHGPHRKHSLYCCRGLFTAVYSSNGHPIIGCVGSRGNVFKESLTSNGFTHHNIIHPPTSWSS